MKFVVATLALLALAGCSPHVVVVDVPPIPPSPVAVMPEVPQEVLAVVGLSEAPSDTVFMAVPSDLVTHGKQGPGFWVLRDHVVGIAPKDPRCMAAVFPGVPEIRTDVCLVRLAVEAKYAADSGKVSLVVLYTEGQ